jgi:hypothetical protein
MVGWGGPFAGLVELRALFGMRGLLRPWRYSRSHIHAGRAASKRAAGPVRWSQQGYFPPAHREWLVCVINADQNSAYVTQFRKRRRPRTGPP